MNSKFNILFSILLSIVEADSSSITDIVFHETDRRLPILKYRPDTCVDVVSNKSRVVVILSSGLEVMCDTQTDGGGWTVFQRRINGNLNFHRGWEEYKYGFGDLADGEFYLGNEQIHRITVQRRHELRIDFKFHHASFFAKYARFSLFGEAEGYRLKIRDFSGNADDSLDNHNNIRFSTYDRDLDTWEANCAARFTGGWWFTNCHELNLNGQWGSTAQGVGINWKAITGYYLSATMTEMKFREIGKL